MAGRTACVRGQPTAGRGSGRRPTPRPPVGEAAPPPPTASMVSWRWDKVLTRITATVYSHPTPRLTSRNVRKQKGRRPTATSTQQKEPSCKERSGLRNGKGEQIGVDLGLEFTKVYRACGPSETLVCLKYDCWLPGDHFSKRTAKPLHHRRSSDGCRQSGHDFWDFAACRIFRINTRTIPFLNWRALLLSVCFKICLNVKWWCVLISCDNFAMRAPIPSPATRSASCKSVTFCFEWLLYFSSSMLICWDTWRYFSTRSRVEVSAWHCFAAQLDVLRPALRKQTPQESFDRRTPNSGRLEQALHQEYQTQPTKLPLFSYYFHYNGTGWAQYLHLPLFRPNMATLATFGLGSMTLTCLLYSVWIFVIGTKKWRYLFMVYIWTVWWL